MSVVFLGLGSNVDAERKLRFAVAELRSRYGEVMTSTVYRNRAYGFDGDDFLNLVVRLETDAPPAEIHAAIEAIHGAAGRVRGAARFTSRPLDIDLLMVDDLVIDEPPVRLPRCDILDYNFVLRPLAEIAPQIVHPGTGQTMAEHWKQFDGPCHPLTPVDVIL